MKKNRLLLFIFFISAFPFFAKNSEKTKINFEPLMGFKNGMQYEYVFINSSYSGNLEKLSELNWPLENAFFYGAKSGISFKNFSFDCYIKSFKKAKTGTIIDNDWYGVYGTPNFTYEQTDISFSDCMLDKAYSFGFESKYTPFDFGFAEINFSISADYDYSYLIARDGYGWYADRNNSSSKKNESYLSDYATFYSIGQLCQIHYERTQFFTWIGTGTKINYKNLSFGINFFVSPFTYTDSIDTHFKIKSQTLYFDQFKDYFKSYKLQGDLNFALTKNIKLDFSIEYICQNLLYGTTYTGSTEDSLCEVSSIPGSSLYYIIFTGGLKYSF